MTTSTKKYRILIVDDDPVSLKILHVILSREQNYEVFQADNADEGIKVAHETTPDIIISDYYMPGMDGFEFCRYIKTDQYLFNTIFILLTAETDVIKKIEGLEGGADDYIEKTVSSSVLLSKVKAFLRITDLQKELYEEKAKLKDANDKLKRNFHELISILLKILEVTIPGAGDRSRVARDAAEYIAKKMGVDDEVKNQIVLGARLHEIGKVGLADNIMKGSPRSLRSQELDAYYQHTVIGSMIISTMSGFKDAAHVVYHQYENYNGSGFPDGLIKNEIPVGSRIIRVIIFAEDLNKTGLSMEQTIEEINLAMNSTLDPSVATFMNQFLIEKDQAMSFNKDKISVEDLRIGMVIAEDIYSSSGAKLLPKDVQLQDRMLQIILKRNDTDPIIGGVYVYK